MLKIILLFFILVFLQCCNLIPENEAPLIKNIYFEPSKIYVCDTTQLSCEAIDIENNKISYKWEAKAGTFLTDKTEKNVKWEAPISEGLYNISVEVSDGKKTSINDIDLLVEFKCGQKIKYYNKIYNTVLIGKSCYFKENLDVGSIIKDKSSSSDNGIIEKYCYNDLPENCDKYGGLYKWDEAMNYNNSKNQGICPEGWHIPTLKDYEYLESISYIDANSLKELNVGVGDGIGNNKSGFSALLTGYRFENGAYHNINLATLFWSSSGYDNNAYYLGLYYNENDIDISNIENKERALSIRCVKN